MVHKLKHSMKNIYVRQLSRALISIFLKQVQEFENDKLMFRNAKGRKQVR